MSNTKRSDAPSWFRYPKTMNEARAAANALEDGVHVRHKRQPHHLPDAWDDRPVAARAEKPRRKK